MNQTNKREAMRRRLAQDVFDAARRYEDARAAYQKAERDMMRAASALSFSSQELAAFEAEDPDTWGQAVEPGA